MLVLLIQEQVKTGAFLIPMIKKVLLNPREQVLILAPTRELAFQIEEELRKLSRSLNISSTLLIGGNNINKQINSLRTHKQFIIGTPGRIKDLMQRGVLKTQVIKNIILDEVDRMLDMGFIRDVTAILENTNRVRQSLFFSATMPPKVSGLIRRFSKEPHTISVKTTETAKTITQEIVKYTTKVQKMDLLHDVLVSEEATQVLIFGRTKRGVRALHRQLEDRGFSAESIHGNKTQAQRLKALSKFKKNKVNILVATDVIARGLDIQGVSHVINFEVPETYEDYVHRIGRTGRANEKGTALTFVSDLGMGK